MALIQHDWHPYKKRRETHKDGHMTTEEEIEMELSQAKEYPRAPRSWKRQGRILPWKL